MVLAGLAALVLLVTLAMLVVLLELLVLGLALVVVVVTELVVVTVLPLVVVFVVRLTELVTVFVFVDSPGQAAPNKPNVKTAERAITFFISIKFSCLLQRIYIYLIV